MKDRFLENDISVPQALGLYVKGFCMGVADIIPGISGGTIAFILGIYEQLIFSIRSFDARFIRRLLKFQFKEAFNDVSWKFLGSVLAGIASAIIILSRLISWLLEYHPILLNAFFFGLIMATIPIIATIIKRWSYAEVLAVLLSGIFTFFLVMMAPLQTPETMLFLFLSGMIAISAMILPGISGAFILVLLGKYQYILQAVNDKDIAVLSVFVAGIVVGIVSFVRFLGWLLHKYHDMTVAILTGIVIGSLNKIWPWKETIEVIYGRHGEAIPVKEINIVPVYFDGEFFGALTLMVAGFFLALALNFSHKKETLKV